MKRGDYQGRDTRREGGPSAAFYLSINGKPEDEVAETSNESERRISKKADGESDVCVQ